MFLIGISDIVPVPISVCRSQTRWSNIVSVPLSRGVQAATCRQVHRRVRVKSPGHPNFKPGTLFSHSIQGILRGFRQPQRSYIHRSL